MIADKKGKLRLVKEFVYPKLGCDIQGFQAMECVSNADLGGSSILGWSNWLYHSEQMGPAWGSVPCHKNIFVCKNKMFQGEMKFSQWKNLTFVK